MIYSGSYDRHTSHCYSDIDICVVTDRPVTPAHRERILDELKAKRDQGKKSSSFTNAWFSREQFAIHVSIPKMVGKRTQGFDEYTVVFQNRQDWSSEVLMYPTLRGSTDRFEADQRLLEFYDGNTGAQNVARLIKYATYMIENHFPGTLIECITMQIAHRLFPAGRYAKAIATFYNADEYGTEYIPLRMGEIVELLDPPHGEHVDESWSYGKAAGVQRGWFPTAYVSDTGASGDGMKAWCHEHQHELYRSVVYEISLGMDSTTMATMIDDVVDEGEYVKTWTSNMINGMSEFYREEENREYVFIKRSPARTWTQWDFLGHKATCVPHLQSSARLDDAPAWACWKCGRSDHFARDCPSPPREMPARAEMGSAASGGSQSTKGQGKGCKGKFAGDVSAGIETETEYMPIPMSAAGFAGLVDEGIPNK
jgi:hypothetical protein